MALRLAGEGVGVEEKVESTKYVLLSKWRQVRRAFLPRES